MKANKPATRIVAKIGKKYTLIAPKQFMCVTCKKNHVPKAGYECPSCFNADLGVENEFDGQHAFRVYSSRSSKA